MNSLKRIMLYYTVNTGIFILFSFLTTGQVLAQGIRRCGTYEMFEMQKQADPGLENRLKMREITVKENRDQNEFSDNEELITIPVVVHVLYNESAENISNEQIYSQIVVLNEDFRKKAGTPGYNNDPAGKDAMIEFALAVRDPQGKATTGITRTYTAKTGFDYNSSEDMKYTSKGGIDPWPVAKYLNIWVCDLGGGYLGYATYPGASSRDGIVIGYKYFGDNTGAATTPPYNKGRTATHEVGHWLNLIHIWGDQECGDDFVSDTPPAKAENYGCPVGKQSNCSGTTTDMIRNYMDYTDDACMNIFTIGQVERMRATLNGPRAGIKTSDGLLGIGSDYSPAFSIFPNPCTDKIFIDAQSISLNTGTVNYTIQDIAGREVGEGILNQDEKILSVKELLPGIYFLRLGYSGNAPDKIVKFIKSDN